MIALFQYDVSNKSFDCSKLIFDYLHAKIPLGKQNQKYVTLIKLFFMQNLFVM